MDLSNRRSILLCLAIVAAILGAVASQQAEEIIVNAVTWVCIALALIAGALL